jgi:branched-chain amino acid transport system permease protein
MFRQLLVNGLIAGSLYALVGVGFSLIFRVLRFFHFTHGLSYASGAYVAFVIHRWSNHSLILVLVAAPILTALFGIALNSMVYRPLRNRNATPLVSLVASLGAYLVGQNILSIVFGDDAKSIRPDVVVIGMNLWGAYITLAQLIIIASALIVVFGCALWLSSTNLGTQIRAVASDSLLSTIVGVPNDRIVMITVAIGTGLGGLAGVLGALDRAIVPTMGLNALLMGVIAMIIGGKESVSGVALGGCVIGLAQNLAVLWIPAAWQDAIVFMILIVFLLLRPQGFWGRPLRKVTV